MDYELGSDCEQTGSAQGCPVWQVNPENLNVHITDVPLWVDSPVGPNVEIALHYNSRGLGENKHGLGDNWVLNYGTSVEQDGNDVHVFMPDGAKHTYTFSGANYLTPTGIYNVLTGVGNALELTLTDGQVLRYAVIGTNNNVFNLVQWRDVHGLALTFSYQNGRLHQVTDALNRVTTISYNGAGELTQVTDFFNRQATFDYDSNNTLIRHHRHGRLHQYRCL